MNEQRNYIKKLPDSIIKILNNSDTLLHGSVIYEYFKHVNKPFNKINPITLILHLEETSTNSVKSSNNTPKH